MSERKPLRTVEEIKLETFDADDVLEDDEGEGAMARIAPVNVGTEGKWLSGCGALPAR